MRTCQRHDLTHVFLAVVALLFLLAFHTSSAKAMGGATPEDIINFEELMDVRWLTCTFEAIETSSEEILYGITFDPDVNAARLTTLPKEDPTHQDLSPIDHFTIVFNSAKTKAHLLWAPRGDQSNEETVDEEVANIYTQPPVWEMGFMQVLIQFPVDFGPRYRTTVSIFRTGLDRN